jgi:hypothetical protein
MKKNLLKLGVFWLPLCLFNVSLLARENDNLIAVPISEEVEITVQGKVTSSENQEPIPGVNIIIKGTTVGTVTDIDGNYTLRSPDDNATLIFSFIGYQPMEVPINSRSEINIILEPDVAQLSEVVVIGYGTQQKRDLTGAVSQVKATQLENENPNAIQV